LQTFVDGWRACGDVVFFQLIGPLDRYLLVHPDAIRQVFTDNRDFPKDQQQMGKFRSFAGEGLTFTDGALWRQERGLMEPWFRPPSVAQFTQAMAEATEAAMRRLEEYRRRGEPAEISHEMLCLGLDISTRAMFSTPAGAAADDIVRALRVLLDRVYNDIRTYISLPEWLPLPANRRFKAARARLAAFATEIMAARRQAGRASQPQDLLTVLLQARDSAGEPLAHKQVHDEIVTMILAAYVNIGLVLTWTLVLLARHPAAARRMRAELRRVLGDSAPDRGVLAKLPYTTMILQEAMRLYPPPWVLGRKSRVAAEIGGYRIPGGASIFVSPYITHRHPGFWDDPEAFEPERFGPGPAATRAAPAYMPFGLGPRDCIGKHLALMGSQMALAMIARRYDLALAPGQTVAPQATLLLWPGDVMMTVGKAADT
jgi:cytochrome P450